MSEQTADTGRKPLERKPSGAGTLSVVEQAGPAASGDQAPSEPARASGPKGPAPARIEPATPGGEEAQAPAAKPRPAKPQSAKPAPKPKPVPAEPPAAVQRPLAEPARPRQRHLLLAASFILLVVAPVLVAAWYLWGRAADQYASYLGFTVRTEELSSPVDILGGLTSLSGGGSSDTDVLYEYIRSRELVSRIDAELDLHAIFSRAYERDPVFAFKPAGPIEELVEYWRDMIRVDYDATTHLMDVRVLAFTPEDAQAIARLIFEESSRVINELSAIAREDTTRYAREDLEQAVERLKGAREALTAFRSRYQIADLQTDIQAQMGLLSTLQQQLAAALIELDLLGETTPEGDPRLEQVRRRISVIESRIAQERGKFGTAGIGRDSEAVPGRDEGYATLIGDFERLSVDREFAEQTYIAALASYDKVRGEALRQSRYLAAYVKPTLAQSAEYPQRWVLVGVVALFCLMGWAILTLIYYSLRDRH